MVREMRSVMILSLVKSEFFIIIPLESINGILKFLISSRMRLLVSYWDEQSSKLELLEMAININRTERGDFQ